MKALLYLPYVSLPNILAGEMLVPELLQDDAQPERLGAAVMRWFDDEARRVAASVRFRDLHLALRLGANERAGEAVLSLAESG